MAIRGWRTGFESRATMLGHCMYSVLRFICALPVLFTQELKKLALPVVA